MTGRIHLDDLTTADLKDLYDRLDAAEQAAELRGRRMNAAVQDAAELRVRLEDAEAAVEAVEQLASRWAVLRAYGGAATELRAALAPSRRPAEPGVTGRRIRAALPVLRAAVDTLPRLCRYHGERLDDDYGPARRRREACCDTGIPARRRREAETALANLDRLARQPARLDVDRAALLPPITEAIRTWRFVGDTAAAEAVLDALAGHQEG